MATNLSLQQNVTSLLDQWIAAEAAGNEYPVPFDMAWPMAGYGRKSTAKRDGLKGLKEDQDFCTQKCKNALAGRPVELINLSVEGFKHLCLMADTPEGYAIRQHFIEAEKKWKTVQAVAPEFAQEIEILQLKKDIAQQEAIAATANQKALAIRQYVATALPEPVQQKILGYAEVKTVEYRDRVIDQFGRTLASGDSINKKQICQRYGLLTKNGAPDYKTLNKVLVDTGLEYDHDAWEIVRVPAENAQLKRDYLTVLDNALLETADERQLYLGEYS